ncbi:uncharacterized protein LOC111277495 [Durio zibethinus]|uniref:Uncharacterized protein LOC111277495 n=1 Tax=Durio zibethinus TaxID=66656 RepID=A0A6P5WV02_DURZI|nr:uncharacterized protein LOC111277495 [Durio zibethinus]
MPQTSRYCNLARASNDQYFICNPTTRKFKMLCFPSPQGYHHVVVNLAFDPLKSPHYKIFSVWLREIKLLLVRNQMNPKFSIDIYSDHGESQYLDVENECVKTMPMPIVNNVGCRYSGESGCHLNLTVAFKPGLLTFSVYAMLGVYSDWYLEYSLNLEAEMQTLISRQCLWSDHVFCGVYLLFCTIQSEEEGDSMFAVFPHAKTISYNFKNGTLKALQLQCLITGRHALNCSFSFDDALSICFSRSGRARVTPYFRSSSPYSS